MSDRRRIVADVSALLPAFFEEEMDIPSGKIDLTRRAVPLVASIRSEAVIAFEPDLLLHEFAKTAYQKVHVRSGGRGITLEEAAKGLRELLDLPIVYVAMHEVADIAWDLMTGHGISPPDSWYLASAIHYDAEFWVSHHHEDNLVANARAVHRKVFVLTEDRFEGLA